MNHATAAQSRSPILCWDRGSRPIWPRRRAELLLIVGRSGVGTSSAGEPNQKRARCHSRVRETTPAFPAALTFRQHWETRSHMCLDETRRRRPG